MNTMVLSLSAIPIYWLATVLDSGLSPRIAVMGGSPSFLLVTALVLALFSRPAGGATAGFIAGLLEGAVAGANMPAYVISRTIGATVASWSRYLGIEVGPILAFGVVFVLSVFTSLLLIFLAPRPDFAGSLGSTIISAIYNGVIAVPFFVILDRMRRSATR